MTPSASFELEPGMDVIIARTGRRGRAIRPDKGKRWIVETETMRLSLLPGELRPAPPPTPEDAAPSVSYSAAGSVDPPVLELHIRGMRLDEAMKLVEKQLDSALLHGLREFASSTARERASCEPRSTSTCGTCPPWRASASRLPEEGGFGKTIVTLKG